MIRWLGLLAYCAAALGGEPDRQVAITIDDLPFAQSGAAACAAEPLTRSTAKLMEPIREGDIPLTAFVIGSNCPDLSADDRRTVLRMWLAAGAELGNHTYSHKSLNTVPLEQYEQDILRAEPIIRDATEGRELRFFRSPMLQTGPNAAVKEGLQKFLVEHGYRQSPVTFDNSDWMFAYVYATSPDAAAARRAREEYVPYMQSIVEFFERRAVEVTGREFPQILLIHANRLNSEMLPVLLDMFRRRGYRFISLEQALADPVYQLPERYSGTGGFSWIHRWSQTMGMANKGEPDEPKWLRAAYEKLAK